MENQIKAVERMQKYIEQHWHQEITLSSLAKASLYSPWYSYRLFVKWLHTTPAEYIRRVRLSQSALILRDSDVRITEVAMQSGYDSVDGFQRAFLREFGCNPSQYAAKLIPIPLFKPYPIQYVKKEEQWIMEKSSFIYLQMVERSARKVILKRGVCAEDYCSYCDEVGCDVWGMLLSIPSIVNEPVCLWLPQQHIKKGTSSYVQGVEVSLQSEIPIPDGFDVIELPAAQYLQFQGEAFEEQDYEEAIEKVQRAIESFNPKTMGLKWDESNPRIQLEPFGERGYIELLPVKKMN